MLKNTDKYKKENTMHFANSEYSKRKPQNQNKKDMIVFISVFFIGLLIILGLAKILSPNVDVEIADNDEYSDFIEEEPTGSVDGRLKHLQMEDEQGKTDDKMFSPELDEKVMIPNQIKKTTGEMELQMLNNKKDEEKNHQTNTTNNKLDEKSKLQENPAPTPLSQTAQPNTVKTVTYRVVVGHYASDKQAEVAKSIIQDAGLGITPIVKNLGNSYTLQVGVFTSHDKAQQLANNLLKNNFPARIVE